MGNSGDNDKTASFSLALGPIESLKALEDLLFSFSRVGTPRMSSHWKTLARYRVINRRITVSLNDESDSTDLESPIKYRLARSHTDFYDAFQLLQHRFLDAGLTRTLAPVRVEPFHLRSDSQVVLASRGRQLIGCLTLLHGKNRLGLPLEHSHPRVFDRLPAKRFIGEVTSLAIDPQSRNTEVFVGLMQLTQLFASSVGIEYAVGVAHPKHARIYRRVMGFEIVGDEVPCTRVGGQPGVALAVKIDENTVCQPRWQSRFDLGRGNAVDLTPSPMSVSQRRFFERFISVDPSGLTRAA